MLEVIFLLAGIVILLIYSYAVDILLFLFLGVFLVFVYYEWFD